MEWRPDYPTAVLDRGIMYAGSKVILYGKYKSLKSMLAQRFALSVASGEPWLGFNTPEEGLNVFYLQLEIPHIMLQKRINKMMKSGVRLKKEIIFWTEHVLKLDLPQGIGRLERYLQQYQPDVLIIDPMYKVLSGNILDAHQVQVLLDALDNLIAKYGVSILLVSHSKKPAVGMSEEWGSDDLLGSVFLSAWADSVVQVQRSDGGLRVKFDVVRHAETEISPVLCKIDSDLTFTMAPLNI